MILCHLNIIYYCNEIKNTIYSYLLCCQLSFDSICQRFGINSNLSKTTNQVTIAHKMQALNWRCDIRFELASSRQSRFDCLFIEKLEYKTQVSVTRAQQHIVDFHTYTIFQHHGIGFEFVDFT